MQYEPHTITSSRTINEPLLTVKLTNHWILFLEVTLNYSLVSKPHPVSVACSVKIQFFIRAWEDPGTRLFKLWILSMYHIPTFVKISIQSHILSHSAQSGKHPLINMQKSVIEHQLKLSSLLKLEIPQGLSE